MTHNDNYIKNRIEKIIFYNSFLFLIFLFWFFYSTFDNVLLLVIICLISFLIVIIEYVRDKKYYMELKEKILYIFLFLIPFFLFINVMLFYRAYSPLFFISFYNLIGIKHQHNFLLFLVFISFVILKLIGIKIYFTNNAKVFEEVRGDRIFHYFANDLNYKKILFVIILFSLAAFIEELIYRSFLLTILIDLLNWNSILSILFISIIFGLAHYTTTQNWSHMLSTFVSSIIYSFALITLGLFYPWLFHLMTNLFVLFFYYQGKKKFSIQK
ncbi:MAG: type II CAAX prenyl endopeptidase Rce1 family protein [Candidatus Thorarchaeota archaeon]